MILRSGGRLAPLLGASGLVFLSFAFFIPVGALLGTGLVTAAGPAPWDRSFLLHVIGFTYGQAFLSSLLSCLVGVGAALVYSELRFTGRSLLWRLSLLPFALPTLLVALGLVGIWGQTGWLGRYLPPGWLYGWTGILLGHVFLNFPLFLKGVGTALVESEREVERAALSLGATRLRCFFSLTLPRIGPEIRTAFVLSFLYCASSFLIVLMLGGGPRFTTLEVAVYQAIKVQFDAALAVRLAAIQAAVTGVLYLLFLRKAPGSREVGSGFFPVYGPRHPATRFGVLAGWAVLLGALAAAPLLSLVGQGLSHLSVLDYSVLFRAALHSVQLGLFSTVFCVGTALALAYGAHRSESAALRGVFAAAGSLPAAFSTLLLTVGWMAMLGSHQDWLRGSLLPAAAVQAVIALPIGFRVLRDGLGRVPPELYPAAASLGASPAQVLRTVELPLLKRALGLSAVLALSFSLGELGAVLLFLGPENETLPLWIFRLMGRYQFEAAYGAALLLLGLMAALFWAIGRLEEQDAQG